MAKRRKKTRFKNIIFFLSLLIIAYYAFNTFHDYYPNILAKAHFPSFPSFPSFPNFKENNPPRNFTEAKIAAKKIYYDHQVTFYCGCKFNNTNQVDLASCGYHVQKDPIRAKRLEWEHIVPMSQLAANLPCWKKELCCKKNGRDCFKGRQCCRLIDPQFSKMEADLHNLVPELGELNALRSNYRFGLLPFIRSNQFGICEIKVDPMTRRVEPRISTRGIIARTYLYMASRYAFHISDSQKQLFIAWDKLYPPEAWEIKWDQRVKDVQGNSNPYISRYYEKK